MPHRERAAHAFRQAKKAFVSSLPSIASRKSIEADAGILRGEEGEKEVAHTGCGGAGIIGTLVAKCQKQTSSVYGWDNVRSVT